jgi:hypothetical protein
MSQGACFCGMTWRVAVEGFQEPGKEPRPPAVVGGWTPPVQISAALKDHNEAQAAVQHSHRLPHIAAGTPASCVEIVVN